VDDIASGGNLKGQNSQPADGVLPTASEAPGGVDEATDVHGEGAVDGVHDGEFGESLHHEVDRDADEGEADEDGGRPAGLES